MKSSPLEISEGEFIKNNQLLQLCTTRTVLSILVTVRLYIVMAEMCRWLTNEKQRKTLSVCVCVCVCVHKSNCIFIKDLILTHQLVLYFFSVAQPKVLKIDYKHVSTDNENLAPSIRQRCWSGKYYAKVKLCSIKYIKDMSSKRNVDVFNMTSPCPTIHSDPWPLIGESPRMLVSVSIIQNLNFYHKKVS